MEVIQQAISPGCSQEFRTRTARDAEEYLEIALKAEKYISQNMRETEDGIYWIDPDTGTVDLSFYSGCAGVVYFYTKLYAVCPQKRYEHIIEQGTAYLLAHMEHSLKEKAIYDLFRPSVARSEFKKGLYFGLAGLGIVFLEVFRLFHTEDAEKGAKAVTNYYLMRQKMNPHGVHWSVSPAIAMDGGIILYLMDFYRTFPEPHLKDLILSAGEYYLTAGKHRKSGALEYRGFGRLVPYSLPNWEFGSGGAGYVLVMLYEFSGDKRFLDAAAKAAAYLFEIQVPQARGALIPAEIVPFRKSQPVFYAGLCSGPVGTSRLFYRLHQNTEKTDWYEHIIQLTDGLESIGVPERRTPGLWNNVSYCCGHGGLIHFYISLYLVDHSSRWHNMAVRSANVILGEMKPIKGDGVAWGIAWARLHPEKITHPIGFFDGAAGIASALLEMYLMETDRFIWTRLIDDPFPEQP